jgi:uncharacterized protein (DUF2062 family)
MRGTITAFLRRLLTLDDTPERIALAFSLGVFLAFSPLLGLHAFLGLILSFSLGLNRVALLLGLFINNPWTLVPIYAAGTYLGSLLMGLQSRPSLPSIEWQALWNGDFWQQLARHWHILKPMMLGSTVLAIFAALLAYLIALHVIRQRRIDSSRPR